MTQNKLHKDFLDKILTVKKQLVIQRVIDKLKESHHIPSPEGKKLHHLGKKLLQQLTRSVYDEKLFLEFLEYATKLQSFEDVNKSLPPIIDDNTVLDDVNENEEDKNPSNDINTEESMDDKDLNKTKKKITKKKDNIKEV